MNIEVNTYSNSANNFNDIILAYNSPSNKEKYKHKYIFKFLKLYKYTPSCKKIREPTSKLSYFIINPIESIE